MKALAALLAIGLVLSAETMAGRQPGEACWIDDDGVHCVCLSQKGKRIMCRDEA